MMRLSLIVYNVFLGLGMLLASPVLVLWLCVSEKARTGLGEKLSRYPAALRQQAARPKDRPRIWFHAVSVGEFNALRPLLAALQGDFDLWISTTTRTGQALARQTCPNLTVFYFPLDFRWVVHRAIALVQPDVLVIAETELWPNVVDIATRRRGVSILLINGRLSPGSFRGYRRVRWLMASVLRQITHAYMQTMGDAERLLALGARPEAVTVAGNLKFDLNPTVNPMQRDILRHLLGFGPADTVMVFASTHAGEDEPLLHAYLALKKDFPELKLILAPRHPERVPDIRRLLTGKGLGFSLRSQLTEQHPNDQPLVVLDTIGELLTVFSLANLAVMGGSFVPRGGQNPLEPLSQRIPVLFGPHMFNFSDVARLLVSHEAGFQVADTGALAEAVTELLTQPEVVRRVVENGQRLLAENRGAKERLEAAIREHLHQEEPVSPV